MTLKAWIIYNGNLPGEDFKDFAEWLKEAAEAKNISATLYANNNLLSLLSENTLDLVNIDTHDFPDFVIFTDKDVYLARHLELLGIPVFNSAESIKISDDKIRTYQLLATHKLPIPKTIISPKIFFSTNNLNITFLDDAISELGFPMIIKEAFGSFGEQVYLIKDKQKLLSCVKEIIGKPFVFQEFISTSYGKDLRLQVVGDQVVATMLRESKNDFRANITAGGSMSRYKPNEEEIKIAVTATQAIGADFAGVDLLFGKDNKPIICEINSNAHIRNLYQCTGVNVADKILEYIIEKLNLKGA